jgi:diguanylate cyclase (GGDEF)-like protein
MIDIDHFKHVNDNEGHLVGDAVLRIAARRLLTAIDSSQLLVRWGGEEFMALAPTLGEHDVAEVAERLRLVVCNAPFSIGEQRALPITVSVGCVIGSLRALDTLIPIADEALYEAKRAGRNQVVLRIAPVMRS